MPSQLDLVAVDFCRANGLAFGGYVGEGAFKRVYKATHADGTEVAVKVLTTATANARTPREVDAIQRCNHPNIGKLRSLGTHTFARASHEYIVEDFLAGGTLTSRTAAAGLTADEVRVLALGLAAALGHLDSQQLVHRDIKPDNIMFRSGSPEPVLVDFGLVRDLRATSLTRTWLPQGPGTPYFASPEQLRNEKAMIDWRSDQFALGVTLCLAALDVHPYRHDPESMGDPLTVDRVANRGDQRPQLAGALNAAGLGALERMTRPWPVERYRRPEDLIAAWI